MNNDFQNTQNDLELESMRQQMTTLKNKLNQQEIVNDHLMRHSMKKTVSDINRTYIWLIVIGLLMVPYGYWAFVKLTGFSMAFWIGTSILMLVCAGATYYNKTRVKDVNLMTNNLVDVSRRMARAKKFDADWLFFGIPAIILWLGWFAYESYLIVGNIEQNWLMYGGIIGGIIGAICGFSIHFKTQRQYQDIIDQIEDITAEQ